MKYRIIITAIIAILLSSAYVYAATSSGGSPTFRLSARTLTIGTTTITFYVPNP